MGRNRKKNKHLPPRVYQRRGKLYYVEPTTEKWIPLQEGLVTWATMMQASSAPAATMSSLWASYDVDVLSKKAAKTAKNRRQEWRQLEGTFGAMVPADIEPHHVWRYWRDSGETEGVKHQIRCLSALLTYARQSGAIKHPNPCFGLQLPSAPPRTRYVTDDEFLAVRGLADGMVGYAMDLALLTAMSQIDILKLERRQLIDDGILFDRRKTGQAQLIEWNEELRVVTAAILKTPPHVRRVLICSRVGKPYTSAGFQSGWKRVMRRAMGVKAPDGSWVQLPVITEGFTFHDLRAKSLSDAKSLEEAQKRGGHADSKITQRVYRRLPIRSQALKISNK
jgi:integrase